MNVERLDIFLHMFKLWNLTESVFIHIYENMDSYSYITGLQPKKQKLIYIRGCCNKCHIWAILYYVE